MAFELDLTCIKIKWYTKFQINMTKHVGEKCGKLWRTDGRTDGWTDGWTDGDPDGRTDGHHHTIIRPVWRRAYKNCWNDCTMPILTPEKRDEWFCFMGDPTACIFRQVVHWNSTWNSFDAIYISNADRDGRDAHLQDRQFHRHIESYCSVTTGVMLWLCFSLFFFFFQCTVKSHLKNFK